MVRKQDDSWGRFTYQIRPVTGMIALKLTAREPGEAVYYRIQDPNGNNLLNDELTELGQEFCYLPLAEEDLGQLKIKLYDKAGKPVADARLNLQTKEIVTDTG